jgi:hypothetical protein
MKSFHLAATAVLLLCHSRLCAQDQLLTNLPSQAGLNAQVGQLACPLQVQGLNIRDASGNLIASSPLLTSPASATTTIGDTLYAVIPPDANNPVTIAVMYQANLDADPSTDNEVISAAQDVMNHNNWTDSTYVIRDISSAGEGLPQGTQFWICSSTGNLTLADSAGTVYVAGPPPPTVSSSDPTASVLIYPAAAAGATASGTDSPATTP